ncbi:MAG TPA: hypothetical protein VG994_02745 [Steroidobacteraceae bacterium]|nr:hypothetical protein [Steroidobacteraceae bacterium]
MARSFRQDQEKSAKAFADIVWPEIRDLCGGGSVRYVENSAHETDRNLDMLAGIDAYQILDGKGVRGIASRVQKSERSWDTFTIRYERQSAAGFDTEYKKRLAAIRSRGELLTPYLAVQAYVSLDWSALHALAVVRVADLFEFAEDERLTYVDGCFPHVEPQKPAPRGRCYTKMNFDESGQAVFLVVPWSLLESRGIRVERRPLTPHRRPPPPKPQSPDVATPLPSGGATAYPKSDRWPPERALDMAGWIEAHPHIYTAEQLKAQQQLPRFENAGPECDRCHAVGRLLIHFTLLGSKTRKGSLCIPCAEET